MENASRITPLLSPARESGSSIAIALELDIELSEFAVSVDMLDNDVNMSILDSVDPQAAAEVRTFAADVSSGSAASIGSSLEVDVDMVEVICFYRHSDSTKLDLLTLAGSCASSSSSGSRSATSPGSRRLQVGRFALELHVMGEDVVEAVMQADGDSTGRSVSEILASKIASAEIFIESILLPEGLTATAVLKETKVVVATEAPSPAPTAVPSLFPAHPSVGDAYAQDKGVEEAPSPTGSPANGPEITTLTAVIGALLVVIIVLLLVILCGLVVIFRGHGEKSTQQPLAFYQVYDAERGRGNAHVGVSGTSPVRVVNGWTGTAESESQ
jgi:hypothetical protein